MQRLGGMKQNFHAGAKACAPAAVSTPERMVSLASDAAILAVSVFIFALLWGLGLQTLDLCCTVPSFPAGYSGRLPWAKANAEKAMTMHSGLPGKYSGKMRPLHIGGFAFAGKAAFLCI